MTQQIQLSQEQIEAFENLRNALIDLGKRIMDALLILAKELRKFADNLHKELKRRKAYLKYRRFLPHWLAYPVSRYLSHFP